MKNKNKQAVAKLQKLRKLVIEKDVDIEFNIRVISKAIDFLEPDFS